MPEKNDKMGALYVILPEKDFVLRSAGAVCAGRKPGRTAADSAKNQTQTP